uniref:Ras converting CAAX endopeptidase 1b n=1 Tax=Sphaeramia orbicularis TaxID=375764 RepID=A0A673A1F6_9TELE
MFVCASSHYSIKTLSSAMFEPEHAAVHQEDHAISRCWVGVLNCLLLSCLYVGSLYIWRSSLPRDHPSVIKRRCVSVLLVSALSPAVPLCEVKHECHKPQ